ncbi:MAG: ATP synthase F1 subunit gamma [Acidobacteria bacterium]|nr:MAG: ATP synthase F1 subunit gamma [Acidobacteriota bacterium]
MPNILDIRRRIRSVTNTRQITKAMKMVSAAKLRRAQDRALAARPYAQMLTNVLKSLVSRAEIYDPETGEPRHPLLAQRPEKNVFLIVVTGDKGLAGAFNTNILKAATKFLESKQGKNIEIETIGRKGRDFLRRRYKSAQPRPANSQDPASTTIVGEQIGVLGKLDYEMVSEFVQTVIDRYSKQEIDSVYFVYNEFKSVISQRLVVAKVLPIERVGEVGVAQAEEMTAEERRRALEAAKGAGVGVRPADTRAVDTEAAKFAAAQVDYIYEQPPSELFNALLPKYVSIQIFHGLLESVAAEHAARMTAMDAATNNATDMVDSLTLAMNRVRQAKITKEIIEIVSGAAAQ